LSANASTLSFAGEPILASNGTSNISTTGTIEAGNIISDGNITANPGYFFIGDGGLLSNISGGGGDYSNSNVASYLSSGTITDNVITSANVSAAYFTGNGSQLSSLEGANVVGTVASAPVADSANSVDGANVTGAVAFATTANSVAGANVTGTVASATVSASSNSVAGANVSGTVSSATVAASANSVAGANVTGQVANALVSGTVYSNAQPNITSVGTLSTLEVTGNVLLGNAVIGNLVVTGTTTTVNIDDLDVANKTIIISSGSNALVSNGAGLFVGSESPTVGSLTYLNSSNSWNSSLLFQAPNFTTIGNSIAASFKGEGGNISNIQAANIVGSVSSATTAGTVTTAAQPNITSVGTLSSLAVSGTTNLGAIGNITITGSTLGQVIASGPRGSMAWATPTFIYNGT
jgi:hypothetical protein